jgi:pimeloyl-ACP methyl ester carboxylesterase
MPLEAFDGLFGERWGDPPPRVLAFHGWGRTRTDLRAALGGLPVIAADLPGFGSSPPPAEACGAAGYARLAAPLLDLTQGPAVLVGHSFGGRVAVALAARHPERVAGLVLTGVPLLRRSGRRARASLRFRAARAAHRIGMLSEERMEAVRRRYGSADYRAAHGVMRDVLVTVVNETYEEELDAISAPVTLLWGRDDHVVPLEVAERAETHLEQVRLIVVEGVGHDLPTQRPDTLHDAVLAHVEGAW